MNYRRERLDKLRGAVNYDDISRYYIRSTVYKNALLADFPLWNHL